MKDIFEGGRKLPLIDQFYSIQGEGYNTGKPAYFIRVGGCDIGCNWCDSKISWKVKMHGLTSVDEIIEKVLKTSAKAIVVTGGEPLTYNLDYLCKKAKENSVMLFLETSGAYPISGVWDWICLSPKKQSLPSDNMFLIADELKVIISESEDIKRAVAYLPKVKSTCKLFLQPEWSKRKETIQEIVEYIKENPIWNLSLQTHKYINIP